MTEQTIGELVALARGNNQEAINKLYSQTVHKARFAARRILDDQDQIEDIIQESYVKAFMNLGKLSDQEKFQGWLDTIVINKCKDYLKKKKPLLFSQVESGEEREISMEPWEENTSFLPEESVDYSETKRLIGEMIDRLPEDQKMCLLLFHYEEKSLNEISEIMECSVNTVKSRLNYARKNLKKQVLELEKKGTKLYCVPLIPFLYWFFRQSMEEFVMSMGEATAGEAAPGVSGERAVNVPKEQESEGESTGYESGTSSVTGKAATASGKTAGLGIKKILLVAAAVSAAAGGSLVYQKAVATPERTIQKFEEAYNEYDLDKMIECMTPQIQREYHSLQGIGGLLGLDPSHLFAAILSLSNWSKDLYDISALEIQIKDVSYIDKKHAVVTVDLVLGTDRKYVEREELYLQKIDGTWYLSE